MANPKTFAFPARLSRRFPDPVFSEEYRIERHILFVQARHVPRGLPRDPNARDPNIRRQVYREVEASLLNKDCIPGTFHLKHKGITLVADRVVKGKGDVYSVTLKPGHGILDGGHTYKLLTEERDEEIPELQYVKFEILTRIPDAWIPDLSAGLNTSVQVQPYSIDNLEGLFDWIKDELRERPYYDRLAWKEGEDGAYSVKDLIGIFTLFLIDDFPNDGDMCPIEGYEKKSNSLKRYEGDQKPKGDKEPRKSYQKLRPLLHEILILHDTIGRDGKKPYNSSGGRYGALKFVATRKRGEWDYPFTGKTSEERLMNGALYPILGAFRWMVEENPDTNEYRWRGGFEAVLRLWKESAAELLKLTYTTSYELGRDPNAIGKSRSHWSNLHRSIAVKELMASIASRDELIARLSKTQ